MNLKLFNNTFEAEVRKLNTKLDTIKLILFDNGSDSLEKGEDEPDLCSYPFEKYLRAMINRLAYALETTSMIKSFFTTTVETPELSNTNSAEVAELAKLFGNITTTVDCLDINLGNLGCYLLGCRDDVAEKDYSTAPMECFADQLEILLKKIVDINSIVDQILSFLAVDSFSDGQITKKECKENTNKNYYRGI